MLGLALVLIFVMVVRGIVYNAIVYNALFRLGRRSLRRLFWIHMSLNSSLTRILLDLIIALLAFLDFDCLVVDRLVVYHLVDRPPCPHRRRRVCLVSRFNPDGTEVRNQNATSYG